MLRLGALIPRSVCRSVSLSVLQKLQKKLQNFTNLTKHSKIFTNPSKPSKMDCYDGRQPLMEDDF